MIKNRERTSMGRSLKLEALEPRILFSGSPVSAEAADSPEAQDTAPDTMDVQTEIAPLETQVETPAMTELVENVNGDPDVSATLTPEGENLTVLMPEGEVVEGEEPPASEVISDALTMDELGALVESSVERWADTGLSEEQINVLRGVEYRIADLSEGLLGTAECNVITIDIDGAGRDWFIDETPLEDEEFDTLSAPERLHATAGLAHERHDLLTTILHEQGHILGLEDVMNSDGGIMYEFLSVGERRLPVGGEAELAIAHSVEGVAPLSSAGDAVDFVINLTSANETVTIVDNNDGTYTATSDSGDPPVNFNRPTSSLTINGEAGDQVIFQGAFDFSASNMDLIVDVETISIGGDIDTGTGDQTFQGNITLTADTLITANNATFDGTVDSDATPRALTMDVDGTAEFRDNVGSGQALASFDTGVTGTTRIIGNTVLDNLATGAGSGLLLNFDASFDPDTADAIVPDLAGATDNGNPLSLLVDDNPAVTFNNPVTGFNGITGAYTLPGAAAGDVSRGQAGLELQVNGGDTAPSVIDPNPDTDSVTFEYWLKPDDLTGNEVIWETGGGTGTGFALEDETLAFQSISGGVTARVAYDLSADAQGIFGGGGYDPTTTGDFIQITGTLDVVTETLELFVNGTSVGTTVKSNGLSDWDGGDPSGLGTVGGSNMGGYGGGAFGFAPFDGQIAAWRLYDGVLTQADIQTNFNAVQAGGQTEISVQTTGTQTFSNNLLVGINTVVEGSQVTFSGSVDADPASLVPGALTVNTTGGGLTRIDGNIGQTTALGGLSTNADGTLVINATDIDVTGSVGFGEATTVNSALTFDVAVLSFGSTTVFNDAVTFNIAGDLSFAGAADLTGGAPVFDVGGTLTFSDTVDFDDGFTAFLRNGVFDGNVTLGGDTSFVGSGNISFNADVTGADTDRLRVDMNGVTVFNAVNVGSLDTDQVGRTELSGDVTLAGARDSDFGDQVLLRNSVTIETTGAGDLLFGSTIDSADGANHDLTLTLTQGDVTFNGDIGTDALGGNSDNNGIGDLNITGNGEAFFAVRSNGVSNLNDTLSYVAGVGQNTQDSTFFNQQEINNLNFALGSAVTFVAANGSTHPGIAGFYRFPASGSNQAANRGAATSSLEVVSGNPSDATASVEFWIRPDSLSNGGQLIWESGGTGSGSNLSLTDSVLTWVSKEGVSDTEKLFGEVSFDLATLPVEEQTDFIHVVAVYQRGGGDNTLSNDNVFLYVNGELRDSDLGVNVDDFVGTDATGIAGASGAAGSGQLGGSDDNGADEAVGDTDLAPAAPLNTFQGDIAIMRLYEELLDDGEVSSAYHQVLGSALTVQSTGDLNFSVAVSSAGTDFNADNITFNSTLDALDGVAEVEVSLNTIGGGVKTLAGDVGGTRELGDLKTNGDGRTEISGDVTVNGEDTRFLGPILLNADVTITQQSATGFVVFGSTIDAADAVSAGLTVNTPSGGTTQFAGDIGSDALGALSNDAGLAFLTTDAAGSTLLSALSETTGGFDFNVDAGLDVDVDDRWEDTVAGNPLDLDFTLDLANGVNRVDDGSGLVTNFAGITGAYDFQGGFTGNVGGALLTRTDTATETSFQGTALGDLSTRNVTLEIWFKPDNIDPTPGNGQILFEDGGGTGTGFLVDDNLLSFRKLPGNGIVSYDLLNDPGGLLSAPATDEFIQAVGTYNTATGVMELFVNGRSVGTDNPGGNDWTGGDSAGVGTRGAANVGGVGGGQSATESFDGEIAIFRYYQDQILTEAEARGNFAAVAGADLLPISVTTSGDQEFGDALTTGSETTLIGANVSADQGITLGDDLTIEVTGDTGEIMGVVSGDGDLIKEGTGKLTLSGANTYTGETTVNTGILVANNTMAFGDTATGTTVIDGAAVSVADGVTVTGEGITIHGEGPAFRGALRAEPGATAVWQGTVTLGDNDSRIGGTAGSVLDIEGIIDDGGNNRPLLISADSDAIVQISNAGNSYTGTTTIVRGILQLGVNDAIQGVLNIDNSSANEDATFDLNGFNQTLASVEATGIGNGTGGSFITNSAGTTSTLTFNPTGSDSYAGVISGNLNIVKDGNGTFTLSGANTYTGTTQVADGRLIAGSDGALGDTGAGTSVASGAELQLADGITISGETLTINGAGTDFRGALTVTTNEAGTWDGDILLGDGNSRLGARDGATLTVSGNIDDGVATRKLLISAATTGTVVLSGSGDYDGGTDIVRGILKLGGDDALPTDTVLSVDSSTANEDSTFDLNGFSQEVAELNRGNLGGTGGSEVTNTAVDNGTLIVNQASNTDFTGLLTGNLNLVKQGAGTLTLSQVNTATGTTSIEGGILNIAGELGNGGPAGLVTIAGGLLAGNGTVNAPVLVNSGSVSPGTTAGQKNTLRIGSLSFGGGTYVADVTNLTNSGVDFDQLIVDGAVDLTDANLDLSFAFTDMTTAGVTEIVLIDNNESDLVTGNFVDMPEGTAFTVNGEVFEISYVGGTGNDVVIRAAGEVETDVSITGGNLVITDDNGGVSEDDLTIKVVAGGYEISDPNQVLGTGITEATQVDANTIFVPFSALTPGTDIVINGDTGDDTLTLDFNGQGAGGLQQRIIFTGGENAGDNDTLAITNGVFDTVEHIMTGGEAGNIDLDDDGTIDIIYSELEPVDMSGSTITDLILTLPVGVDNAQLSQLMNGNLLLSSTDGTPTFESTEFAAPSGSVTIAGGTGDVLTVVGDIDISAANSSLIFNVATINLDATSVNTGTGDQSYRGITTLGVDSTLTAGDVTFTRTVNSDGTPRSLTVNASGTADFRQSIGNTSPLSALDTSGSNLSEFGVADITTITADQLVLNWDAALDTPGDNVWDTAVNPAGSDNWIDFTGTGGFSPIAINDPTFPGITQAYSFGGATGMQGRGGVLSWESNLGTGIDLDATDASVEFILRPEDFDGTHIIWETGGTGQGTVLAMEGSTLLLEVRNGGDTRVSLDLATLGINPGDWFQAIAVMDLGSPGAVELYVNGPGNVNSAAKTYNDYTGGGNAGIANGESTTPANAGDLDDITGITLYNGDIAAIRHYAKVLSGAEIQNNFDALQQEIPAPVSINAETQTIGNAVVGNVANFDGDTVTYSGTLNDEGNVATASDVTVTATTSVTFSGIVGGIDPLTSLTTTTPLTLINSGAITTSGNQSYSEDVTIADLATTLTATGGSISVGGNLTSPNDLMLNTGVDVTVTGVADLDGTTTIDAGGNILFTGMVDAEGNFTITNANNVTFDGAVDVAADVTVNADNNVSFNSTLTGVMATDVDVTTDGTTLFGGTTLVGTITTDLTGDTSLGGDLTLLGAGDSIFRDRVLITDNLTITTSVGAGDVVFNSSVDSENGENNDLTFVLDGGDVLFNGDIGADGLVGASDDAGLGNLAIMGASGQAIFGARLTTIPGRDPLLNYVAGAGPNRNDNTLEDLQGTGLDFNLGSSVVFDSNPVTNFEGITGAYTFPNTGSNLGTDKATAATFESAPGNPGDQDSAYEFWIKPDSLTGPGQVIWESGGLTTGSNLTLTGSVLSFIGKEAIADATADPRFGQVSFDLSTLSADEQADFIQIMVVYNRNTAGGTNDQLELYVNGVSRDSINALDLDDIIGSDGTGLGGSSGNQSSIGGNDSDLSDADPDSDAAPFVDVQTFAGQIAIVRAYDQLLNAEQVADTFALLSTPLTVRTAGDQTFDTNVLTDSSVTFRGANVSINASLDAQLGATAVDVNLVSTGNTTINGEVGGTGALRSLQTNFSGEARLNNDINVTSGANFQGAVILETDVTITNSGDEDVKFGSTINSSSGNTFSLTVDTQGTGATVFNGDIGLVDQLSSLTTGEVEFGDLTDPEAVDGAAVFFDTDDVGDPALGWTQSGTSSYDDATLPANVTESAFVSSLPGIAGAFTFNGTPATFPALATLGDAEIEPATWEVWIRPSDLTGNEVIFESGGTGNGMSVNVEGGNALFAIQTGSTNQFLLRGALPATATTEFVQLVAVWDQAVNELSLYIDGEVVDQQNSTGLTNWDGGNGAGLGGIADGGFGGGSGLGGFGGYTGDIALMRVYTNQALSADQVRRNFGAIAGSTPGAIEVATTGDQSFGEALFNVEVTTDGENVEFTSTVNLQTNDFTVNVTGDNSEVTGDITGSGNLSKQGVGRLALEGGNTFTGTTTVEGGELSVNGSSSSDTTVQSTATLAGTGTVSGTVTVNTGGMVSPGVNGTGTLNVTNGIVLDGTLDFDVTDPDIDLLNVEGGVDITGADFNPTSSDDLSGLGTITVVQNDDSDPVVGTFNGLGEGDQVIINGSFFHISYVGGDGNDIVLTANVAPTVTVDATDVNEGSESTLTGTITDPDLTDTHVVTVDWGDPNDVTEETFNIPATNSLVPNTTTVVGSRGNTLTITDVRAGGEIDFSIDRTYLDDGLNSDPRPVAFMEVDGIVAGEAVHFSDIVDAANGEPWEVQTEGTLTNSRTGEFLQVTNGGVGPVGAPPNRTPYVDYEFTVENAGDWRLFLNHTGPDGGSDSIYATIVELQDGTGALTNPDWYRFTQGANPDFRWQGSGEFEGTSGGGNNVPSVFTLEANTTYTLRVMPREDGAALDAWALVNEAIASGPSGTNPGPDETGVPTQSDPVTITVTVEDRASASDTDSTEIIVSNVESTVALTGQTVDENADTIVVTGTYEDPGTLDTQKIEVDWQDANDDRSATFELPALFSIDPSTGVTTSVLTAGMSFASTTDDSVLFIDDVTAGVVSFSIQKNYLDDGAVHVESGGIVSGEATEFSTTTNNGSYAWEQHGTSTDTNPFDLEDSRSGDFMQALFNGTDAGGLGGGVPNGNPALRYTIEITTPGEYRLFLHATGFDSGSDSLYATITELQDGDGGANADYYRYAFSGDSTFDWEGTAGFETTSLATAVDPDVPATFDLAPGLFTLHIIPRESGAALDAWTLQLSSMSAPTGTGPANTTGTPSDVSNVSFTITDDDGGTVTDTTGVTVENSDPENIQLNLNEVMIEENNTATVTGSFTDQGTLDQHQVVVDWGDDNDTANATFNLRAVHQVDLANGTTSSLLAVNDTFNSITDDSVLTITGVDATTGTISFSVTHLYQDDGNSGAANGTAGDVSTISVTVTDDDTGTATETIDITVENTAPTLTLDAVTPILEDETITLTGSYTDTGFLDQQVIVIDWDDHRDPDDATFTIPAISQVLDKTNGTPSDLLMVGDTINSSTDEAILTITGINRMTGEVTFSVMHTYVDDGTPLVSVTVTDDDTGAVTETVPVTVGVIQPSLKNLTAEVLRHGEGEGPILLFPQIEIVDNPSELYVAASITIVNGFAPGEDILGANPPAGFTASYDPSTGTLTITAPVGGATIFEMESALRTVFYNNSDLTDPTAGLRIIGVQLDEGSIKSDIFVVSVLQLNDPEPVPEVPVVELPDAGVGEEGDVPEGGEEGDGGLDLAGISSFLRDLSEGEIFFGTDPLEVQRLVEEAGLGTRTSPVGGLPGNGFFGGTPGTGTESTVLTEFSTVIGGRTVPGAEVTITLTDGLGGQSLTQSMLVDETGEWLFNYGGLQLQDRPYLLRVEIEMPDPFNPGEFITVISHYILTGDMLMGPSGERMITEGIFGIAVVKLENQ